MLRKIRRYYVIYLTNLPKFNTCDWMLHSLHGGKGFVAHSCRAAHYTTNIRKICLPCTKRIEEPSRTKGVRRERRWKYEEEKNKGCHNCKKFSVVPHKTNIPSLSPTNAEFHINFSRWLLNKVKMTKFHREKEHNQKSNNQCARMKCENVSKRVRATEQSYYSHHRHRHRHRFSARLLSTSRTIKSNEVTQARKQFYY